MSSVKSFKKAQSHTRHLIAGTKYSSSNFSLLTSSGLPSLDALLGGGIPIGSIVLIEEDQDGLYTETIAKHYVAEGILSKHRILLASQDTNLDNFLNNLPGPIEKEQVSSDGTENNLSESEMTIAWRYKNLKVADTSISGKDNFGSILQINTPLDSKYITDADIIRLPLDGCSDPESSLGSCINETLNDPRHISKNEKDRQVARLTLLNLGSPCWDKQKLAPLLYSFRSLIRKSVAVGLVTVPSHLYQDSSEVWKWINFADICIKLESFAGSARAKNPALKDYHGFFHILKLPAFNSLCPFIPPSDLAFKLRRRKFVIERLSLPPELEDTSARGAGEKLTGCGSAAGFHLDF